MELELQRQQQEAMDRQMAQMKLMFEEQFKKQQDEIENLRKEKKKESEFTVPTKPVRGKTTNQPAEKSESFKIYSDNSLKSEPTSSSLLEDTKMLLQMGGSANNSGSSLLSRQNSQKTPPRVENNLVRALSQPSPTINTKEAMQVMQEMWGQGGAGQPSQPQKFEVFQEPSKPKQPTFEVFQEPEVAKPKPFEIFQESSAPTAKETKFEIFQDKENQLVSKPKPVIRDENDFPAAEPKFQKTRKSGLQPMPIEDYDEENPKTMMLPSMEDFEKMAKAASTPFSGRGFMPDEDENTCAVNVIFKKPPALPQQPQKKVVTEEDNQTPQINIQPPTALPLLSPIMETSREHYKSSSTSSSNASHFSHLTKSSHWGNTMHSTTPGTFLQSNKSLAASNKSSFKPTELTANSGYMADDNISQARTPGKVKIFFLRSF
jgi:hypothetical protein